MSKIKKIAVAMSGGVDSSVAAFLLKREGYDVTGVNLNLWSCFQGSKSKTCCSPQDRRDAAEICEILDIPFVSIDMRKEFKEKIVLEFVSEYSKGRTPNPCIRCNTLIKFDAMLGWVNKELGIEEIATGHYARLISDSNGVHLLRGNDSFKDQTYFLFDISKDILMRLRFPLGCIDKDKSRKIALEAGLPVAEKIDSQEVCFIPDNDVASFIEDYYQDYAQPSGNYVDKDGNVLGRHKGTHSFTIGQRRGLNVSFGERRYVTKIDPKSSTVVLGGNEDLMGDKLIAEKLNMIENPGNRFRADVKIRYKSEPKPASVELKENGTAVVKFDDNVRAITPGQAAVFYDGDLVIGGGWIK